MKKEYDFVVIGGGSAGYAAARTAAAAGKSVAVVDGADELGGLCILRGCMPSKTLLYTAEILHHARHGKIFGLDIPEAAADMKAVHQRKVEVIREFAEYRQEGLESGKFDLFRARGHFTGEDTVSLEYISDEARASAPGAGGSGDAVEEIRADHFVVATGSVVNWPNIPGLHDVPAVTSDEILDLDYLPESVIVLGGGVVACELAQFLNRMGSRVTLIQRSPLVLHKVSPEGARVVMQAFEDEGMEVFTGTRIQRIDQSAGRVYVSFEYQNQTVNREAQLLFNALGRSPNSEGLGLDQAGVEVLPSGHIRTDSRQLTTNPRVYAVGDVAGPHEIVHVAIMQGEVAARHALGQPHDPVDYDLLTNIVFTDPQVAAAGIPEQTVRDRGIPYAVAEYPFDDHGKSILMEAKYGYVKVWADRADGRVLGAECVGKDAGELIHAFTVAVALRANVRDLLKAHWYHPTLSEIWTYPLEDIAEELGMMP